MAGEPVAGHREPSKLEAVREARRAPLDEARPAAIARHKAKGRLTARENIAVCDTPGLMVGPETERTGLVRRSARLLTKLTHATTPVMTVVLRKAYGLCYYVMGSRPLEPSLLLAWPTAEFGGMGLEGAVNIILKKELDAIEDARLRAAFHRDKTEALKRADTALGAAARFDVVDVIDPADTRRPLAQTPARLPLPPPRVARKHPLDPF
jgi:acetyl-CoA carboxylase carboxyltransferase component